ncbi:MAG: Ig-like domain-containing protein [Verrucomicrobiota bacterium]
MKTRLLQRNLLSSLVVAIMGAASLVAQPVITSPTEATGQVGEPFEYEITTDVAAFGFVNTELPAGLSRSGAIIAGNPNESGVFLTTLNAFDVNGTSAPFDLVIIINNEDGSAPTLEITSPTSVSGEVGGAFTYQIEASPDPVLYEVFGVSTDSSLPDLGPVDGATGLLTGTLPNLPGAYDFFIFVTYADGSEISAQVQIDVIANATPVVSIVEPTSSQLIGSGESVDFEVTATTTVGSITQVDLLSNGEIIASDTQAPFNLSPVFNAVGVFEVTAQATNTGGFTTTASETITVTVESFNPVIRDFDFVTQTYQDIYLRPATNSEINDGLSFLAAGNTRGALIARIMSRTLDQLDITTVLQIYRTMVGFWPDRQVLANEITFYQAPIDPPVGVAPGVGRTNRLYALSLEDQFRVNNPQVNFPLIYQDPAGGSAIDPAEWNNEIEYINVLYRNKFGVSLSELNLNYTIAVIANALLNTNPVEIQDGGLNDLAGQALADFATITTLSFPYKLGPSGFYFLSVPLPNSQSPSSGSTQTFGFEMVNLNFPARVQVALLIASLLEREPTDAEVTALAGNGFDLATVAQEIITSPEYMDRFVPAFTVALSQTGSGEITIEPLQEDPNNESQFIYNEGTTITLTATPAAGFFFQEWLVNGQSNTLNPLSLIVTADLAVEAIFAEIVTTSEGIVEDVLEEAGVTTPALIFPTADADFDGHSNIEELAMGTNLIESGSVPEITINTDEDAGTVTLVFVRLKASEMPSDLTMIVECSPDLGADWNPINELMISTNGVSQDGLEPEYERVSVELLYEECQFVRIRFAIDS